MLPKFSSIGCAKHALVRISKKSLLLYYAILVLVAFLVFHLINLSRKQLVLYSLRSNKGHQAVQAEQKQVRGFLEELNQPCEFKKFSPEMSLTSVNHRVMEDPDLLEHIARNVLIDLGSVDNAQELPEVKDEIANANFLMLKNDQDNKNGGIPQLDPSQSGGFTSKLLLPNFFSDVS